MRNAPHDHFDIHATKPCILNSERNSLTYCIFAQAVRVSVPGSEHILVDKKEVRFSWKGYRYVFPTPAKSAAIATEYDNGTVAKKDIQPWRDVLRDPISVEAIQHRRRRKVAATRKKTFKKTSRRKRDRCSRWNGLKV
jgi:hypothetical protein